MSCNADMHVGEIRQLCKLDEAGDSLLRAAMSQLSLSARAYHRILKTKRMPGHPLGFGGRLFFYVLDYRGEITKGVSATVIYSIPLS